MSKSYNTVFENLGVVPRVDCYIISNIHKKKHKKKEDLVGTAHGSGFVPLGKICGKAKSTFRVLDNTAKISPFFEHFLGRMLRLNVEILIEVTLHFSFSASMAVFFSFFFFLLSLSIITISFYCLFVKNVGVKKEQKNRKLNGGIEYKGEF